ESRPSSHAGSHEGTGAKNSAGDEYRQVVPASRPTDRIGSGSKSPHRRAGYRSDNPRAGAAGTASPASSRCSGTTAAIELGEGDHRAKRREQGVFRDPQ